MNARAKSNIILKIRKALQTPLPVPFPDAEHAVQSVFPPPGDDLSVLFAREFTALQGHFSYCADFSELAGQLQLLSDKAGFQRWYCADDRLRTELENLGWRVNWHPALNDCHASITRCESLIARTGTIVLSSRQSSGRTTSVYAPVHVCVATTDQLVYDVSDALNRLKVAYGERLPSQISFASGPSRTADIEKTLVTGVHGPKEVFCFLVEPA